jgi:hypothetical protein
MNELSWKSTDQTNTDSPPSILKDNRPSFLHVTG